MNQAFTESQPISLFLSQVANTRDPVSNNSTSEVKDAVITTKKQKPTIILNEEGIEKILGVSISF